MKKVWLAAVALCLAVTLLLGGCGLFDGGLLVPRIKFEDMEYTRPDVQVLRSAADTVVEQIPEQKSADRLMEDVYGFYEAYHDFYTNYALADIHYCKDLTDIYWEEEYNYCLNAATEVDSLLDRMLYALAGSDLVEQLESEDYFGAGFFDDFQGESVWTEEFTALAEQEAKLQSRYYELSVAASAEEYYSDAYFEIYGTQMAELYVQLVALRQQMAKEAGYEDYPSFAYDFYYYRDYTPDQAAVLAEEIREHLVPIYRRLEGSSIWHMGARKSTEEETFAYVKNFAENMGGTVHQAFQRMEQGNLYDISLSNKKYDASFEVYLSNYYSPYIFVNPQGTVYDQLTFAHEFGHFCNDFASGGTVAGVDVAEVFSQSMELLSLCYAEASADMEKLKMADCLSVYVEQAAYASFEQQVYALTGEDLTAENVHAIYQQVGEDYGFDTWNWDSRSFVCVTHFFTNPMYIISYVVSNDGAMQIYRKERQTAGAGLALFEQQLTTEEEYFLSFVEAAGLESPFTQGRLAQVGEMLEDILFS